MDFRGAKPVAVYSRPDVLIISRKTARIQPLMAHYGNTDFTRFYHRHQAKQPIFTIPRPKIVHTEKHEEKPKEVHIQIRKLSTPHLAHSKSCGLRRQKTSSSSWITQPSVSTIPEICEEAEECSRPVKFTLY